MVLYCSIGPPLCAEANDRSGRFETISHGRYLHRLFRLGPRRHVCLAAVSLHRLPFRLYALSLVSALLASFLHLRLQVPAPSLSASPSHNITLAQARKHLHLLSLHSFPSLLCVVSSTVLSHLCSLQPKSICPAHTAPQTSVKKQNIFLSLHKSRSVSKPAHRPTPCPTRYSTRMILSAVPPVTSCAE